MVRGADAYGVDSAGHFVEHFLEVFEFRDVGEHRFQMGGVFAAEIDVAQGDDIGETCGVEGPGDGGSLIADADAGEVYLFIGSEDRRWKY